MSVYAILFRGDEGDGNPQQEKSAKPICLLPISQVKSNASNYPMRCTNPSIWQVNGESTEVSPFPWRYMFNDAAEAVYSVIEALDSLLRRTVWF